MIRKLLSYLRHAWDHLRCGHHSGIPLCCNMFYSLVVGFNSLEEPAFKQRYRDWATGYDAGARRNGLWRDFDNGPGFVPCPLHRVLETPYRFLKPCTCAERCPVHGCKEVGVDPMSGNPALWACKYHLTKFHEHVVDLYRKD